MIARFAPALLLAATGCQFFTGVVPCARGEACPSGDVCDPRFHVCTASLEASSGEGEGEGAARVGEGEGEGSARAGEGEGSTQSGEGEGEGAAHVGEGEGSPGEGEGSLGEGEGSLGEGEGEGTAPAVAVCGDGTIDAGEQCDDGNRVSGDGCSSTCRSEQSFTEQEPDDFPDQSGVLHLNAPTGVIHGSLGAATANGPDTDGFFFAEPAGSVVRVQVYTVAGNACDTSEISLGLFAADANVSFLREADDNAIGGCPELLTVFDQAQFSFALFEVNGHAVPSYLVEIAPLADRGAEKEPNDDIAHAERAAVDGRDVTMAGTIGSATDVDVYEVIVPPGEGLRAEIAPASSATGCDAFNAAIALLDDAGNQLLGRGSAYAICPFVDGTGPSARDAVARNGTAADSVRYVAVTKGASGFAGALPYKIAFTVR